MNSPRHWDIFCRVVDNYGDVGVSWRLARQLIVEHGRNVRLFVDVLPALGAVAPEIDVLQREQTARGVRVLRWDSEAEHVAATSVADVVIEAFGCGLPQQYLAAMCERAPATRWINLEYLSAESWIEHSHGVASRHPKLPLTRKFYFPGFTAASGGLLRESGLFERRDAFKADDSARAELFASLGLPAIGSDAVVVSLFCYANRQLPSLLEAWAEGDQRVVGVVPQGVAASELDRWLSGAVPHAGQTRTQGNLTLAVVPFVAQDDFDRRLWACDMNFVRGEDSFVRGLWAARPFIWQLYPQADDAQLVKLDAMIARYGRKLPGAASAPFAAFSRAWNDSRKPANSCATLWPALTEQRKRLGARTREWADELASRPDLAFALVKTVESWV